MLNSVFGAYANNPILLLLGVSLAGYFAFLIRKVPGHLLFAIRRTFVITVVVRQSSDANIILIYRLLQWYMDSSSSKNLRDFSLEPCLNDRLARLSTPKFKLNISLFPGFITMPIFYKGTFGWLTRTRAGDNLGASVTVGFFTRSKEVLDSFLKEMQPPQEKNTVEVFGYSTRRTEWSILNKRPARTIDSVHVPKLVKDKLLKDIASFYVSRAWYENHGVVYKNTYMFFGEPGTGKSSLIFALASHFKKPIYLMATSGLTEESFLNQLTTIPRGAFVVLEDVDALSSLEDRSNQPPDAPLVKSISLSSVLNALDGIGSLDGNLIFLTTNYYAKLDKAMTRKGRIDHAIELYPLGDTEIKEYIHKNWGVQAGAHIEYLPILGCDIQSLLVEHSGSYSEFERFLQRK